MAKRTYTLQPSEHGIRRDEIMRFGDASRGRVRFRLFGIRADTASRNDAVKSQIMPQHFRSGAYQTMVAM